MSGTSSSLTRRRLSIVEEDLPLESQIIVLYLFNSLCYQFGVGSEGYELAGGKVGHGHLVMRYVLYPKSTRIVLGSATSGFWQIYRPLASNAITS